MSVTYAQILAHKYANAQWSLDGDDLDTLVWLSDEPKPTQTDLDALAQTVEQEIARIQADKIAAKNSALAKLGLTADEIAALFG
jgi:hypothetical protein